VQKISGLVRIFVLVASFVLIAGSHAHAQADRNNPQRDRVDAGNIPHYHVSICDGTNFVWKEALGKAYPAKKGKEASVSFAKDNNGNPVTKNTEARPAANRPYHAEAYSQGTDGSIDLHANSIGNSEITVTFNTGEVIHLTVHVIRCNTGQSIFQHGGYRETQRPSDTFDSFTGLNGGLQFSETSAELRWIERLDATGVTTNEGRVRRDPAGIGFTLGYGFKPWGNAIVVDPFISVDVLGWSVNQNFAGGNFLGTKSNVQGTLGVKIGPALGQNGWLYGIAGASALNEKLTVQFLPLSASRTQTVPGGTIGVGGAYMLPAYFSLPVAVFAEYQHTWWGDADFNRPASSPLFKYNFQREDDAFKAGFSIYFRPPSAPAAYLPVKAPALK
jgi:hypothetical protein